VWLPYGLAIIVGSFALILVAARDRRRQLEPDEESGSGDDESWLAQELSGRGSPPGFYVLGFFALVTIMLTGIEGPYAAPAWAGLALGVAWGIANARFRSGEGSEG
jgi:hypothetical protein